MARRDGKDSALAIMIAGLSLVVSAVAGYYGYAAYKLGESAYDLSYQAWTRPIPADPTILPTFAAKDGSPEAINAGEGGRKFFEFLNRYSGRKVRIIAWIDDDPNNPKDVQVKAGGTHLEIRPECKDCDLDILDIKGTGKDRPGLWINSGAYVFQGYFANNGKISHRQGIAHWEIYAMDIVTAVS